MKSQRKALISDGAGGVVFADAVPESAPVAAQPCPASLTCDGFEDEFGALPVAQPHSLPDSVHGAPPRHWPLPPLWQQLTPAEREAWRADSPEAAAAAEAETEFVPATWAPPAAAEPVIHWGRPPLHMPGDCR